MSSPYPKGEAGAIDLGLRIREFRPRPWWIGLLVCLVFGAALTPVILHAKSIDNASAMVAILAAVIAAAGGGAILCAIMFPLSVNRRVTIHEKGVVIRDLFGTSIVPFDQIGSVYFHMSKLIMGQRAWLVSRGGQTIELPGMIVGLFDAYEVICEGIKPRVLAEVRGQVADGQTVPFGNHLTVSHEGLSWKGRMLWWEGVQTVFWAAENHQQGNAYAVRSIVGIGNPGCERVLAKAIPNLLILLEFLESDYGVKIERSTGMFR